MLDKVLKIKVGKEWSCHLAAGIWLREHSFGQSGKVRCGEMMFGIVRIGLNLVGLEKFIFQGTVKVHLKTSNKQFKFAFGLGKDLAMIFQRAPRVYFGQREFKRNEFETK